LGNPANCAGFPLSHSDDGGAMNFNNRTFHLLQKPDILTCYEQQEPTVRHNNPADTGSNQAVRRLLVQNNSG
ncbi:MAG: hypothetical protein WBS19_13305, partial [Candidatus Korobacteraceae bacterium]